MVFVRLRVVFVRLSVVCGTNQHLRLAVVVKCLVRSAVPLSPTTRYLKTYSM